MVRKTSIETYHKVLASGLVNKLKAEVYSCIFNNQDSTQEEIFKLLNIPKLQKQSVTPRFAELLEMELIEISGERECSHTGNNVYTWRTTDNTPKKIVKPTKVKCLHCNGLGHVIQERLF